MGCRYVTVLEDERKKEYQHEIHSFEKEKHESHIALVNNEKPRKTVEFRHHDIQHPPKIERITKDHSSIPEHIRKYQTQDQLTAHHASTYLITCMDFRLLDDVVRAMDFMGFNNNYDQFIVAGSSLGFVQDKFAHWGQTVMDHMEIGLTLHHFRNIIIIDHEDCGAFKKFMPYKNKEEELENHRKCLQEAYNKLKKKFPDFSLQAFIMDLHGNMKEIAINTEEVKYDVSTADNEKTTFLAEMGIKGDE